MRRTCVILMVCMAAALAAAEGSIGDSAHTNEAAELEAVAQPSDPSFARQDMPVAAPLDLDPAGTDPAGLPWGGARLDPSAQDEIARYFMWAQANSMAARARTTSDFDAAAAAYGRLVDAGVRNSHLFYNIGTALLLAGRYDASLRWLARAERYAGTTWEIRRNMAIASARAEVARAAPSWRRHVFFWHYLLGMNARIAAALCVLAVGVAFSLIWLLRRRRGLGVLSLAALALFVLLASSAAVSIAQEAREPARFFQASQH